MSVNGLNNSDGWSPYENIDGAIDLLRGEILALQIDRDMLLTALLNATEGRDGSRSMNISTGSFGGPNRLYPKTPPGWPQCEIHSPVMDSPHMYLDTLEIGGWCGGGWDGWMNQHAYNMLNDFRDWEILFRAANVQVENWNRDFAPILQAKETDLINLEKIRLEMLATGASPEQMMQIVEGRTSVNRSLYIAGFGAGLLLLIVIFRK